MELFLLQARALTLQTIASVARTQITMVVMVYGEWQQCTAVGIITSHHEAAAV